MRKANDLPKTYPASVIQQQFWIVSHMDPGNSAQNIPSVFRIKGPLNISALKNSVLELLKQHSIFRTTFLMNSGILLQVITEELPDINVVSIPETHSNKDLWDNYFLKEIKRPFDLKSGPLVRASIYMIDHDEFYFLFIMHHSITDLHSKNMIGQELTVRYNEIIKGSHLNVIESKPEYCEYALSHTRWLDSAECSKMLIYWKNKLAENEGHLVLPVDYQRPAVQSLNGDSVPFYLDKTLTEILKKNSRKNNVTIFLTLLSAYIVVLYRYSNQNNITVGVPFTNRRDEQSKNMMGCFTSILPISITISDETGFNDLLKQVRSAMLEAHKNQEVPLKTIIDNLHLKKDPAYNPVFQVGFTFENPMMLEFEGVQTVSIPVHCGGSQLDLFPVLWDTGDEIRGHIEYCTDLFEQQTIKRFIEHFNVIIKGVIQNSPLPVSQWDILGFDEKNLIINKWNSTEKPYPEQKGIHCFFEIQTQKTPNSIAIRYGNSSWTYNDLNRRANCLAHWLMSRGVKPGVPVGIFMERSFEMIVAIYGIVKAGGAYVPIDPGLPDERIEYMVNDTNVSLILTHAIISKSLPSQKEKFIFVDEQWPEIEKKSHENPVTQIKSDDPVYIIYTSGSTGHPKGVINTHKGIINRILWMQDEYNLTTSDVVLQKTPYSFDVSVWEFFWPLLFGSSLVIANPEAHKDSFELIRIINNYNVTTVHFVPSMLNAFLENPEVRTCKSIKKVICSGEALTMALQKKFFSSMNAELHNLYGPTEAAVDVTSWICKPDDNRPTVPIGKPIVNTKIFILDKFMHPVPIGVTGELHIGGVQVAAGYLNRSELTQEKFVPDHFSWKPGAKLYKTGDLARFLPDGNIEYIGRNDSQVKIRGFRVEMGEIESRLCMHSGISQAAVVKKEFNTEDSRLIAYITPDIKSAYTVKKIQEISIIDTTDHKTIELPNGMIVSSMNDNVTQFMYEEIFEKKSYIQHGISLNDGACVFDVGANIGLFSIFVATQVKQPKIYSFEPLQPIFNVLKQNAGFYDFNIKTHPYGLSDKNEIARFTFYPQISIFSSRYENNDVDKDGAYANFFSGPDITANLIQDRIESPFPERLKKEVHDCQLKTISDVIHEENISIIDLLKIGVEKAENDVIAGISEHDWCKIKQLCIEVHDSTGKKESLVRLLEEKGFNVVSVPKESSLVHMVYAVHKSYPFNTNKHSNSDLEHVWYSPKRLIDDAKKKLIFSLPEYMVPSIFVILPEMPLTSSGKIDRKLLPEPVLNYSVINREYIAPVNEMEKSLAELWEEVLKIDKLSVEENFFDAGGTSLLSVYLIAQISVRFGYSISVGTFFLHPTVRSLSDYITSEPEKGDELKPQQKKRAELRKRSLVIKKQRFHTDN